MLPNYSTPPSTLAPPPPTQSALAAAEVAVATELNKLVAVAATTGAIVGSVAPLLTKNKTQEMTKRKSPEYIVTFPDEKRRKTSNKNSRNQIVPYKPRTVRTGMVSAPVSAGVVVSRSVVPRFNMNGAATVVRNTEVFSGCNLPAAGAYAAFNVALIPTIPAWLARIADVYSKYRFRQLRLVYVPICPTSTSGTIAMAITYDRQDGLPASMASIAMTNKAILFPPYAGYSGASMLNTNKITPESIFIDIDVTRFEKTWYNTTEAATLAAMVPALQTAYAPCTMQVAQEGGPLLATPAGTIYIQYVIEFIEPINPTMNI